jgi:zinc protease
MKRTAIALIAAASAAACAPAATTTSSAVGVPPADYPTTAPTLGPAPSLRLPEPVQRSLPNGMTVLYVRKAELPIVQAVLLTRGGMSDDEAGLPGLASFTAAMLDEGAGGRDALELADAIEQLGATLSTGAAWDASQVTLGVLRDRFSDAIRLMADVVIRPDFPAAEVQRLREERLTELARGRDEARVVAGNAFSSLLYGGDHPYGRLASTESVRRIDRAALERFHREFYRPGSATLILVGDVDESLHPVVERAFGGWRGGAADSRDAPAVPAAMDASRIFLVDMPGAAQSEIRIGHPAVARDHPDFYALTVMNTLLGGSFTSRLMQNLRETHGYTYGAGSSFQMRRGAGPFLASSAVVTAKTDSAVIEFFRELNRIRDEVVPHDELERAKNYVALRLPQSFETTGQVAARIAELVIHGLPLDYYETYVERVMAVDAAEIQRVARTHLRPDRSAIVVVGDRETVESGLRALPVGQVEVRALDEFVR